MLTIELLPFRCTHFSVDCAKMIARLSFLLVTIAALCASAMAVEMTDNQVAFYLRGADERQFLDEVS